MDWGFYGRADELRALTQILGRNRWYFAKMTGRRRIGKTTLIQKAIQASGDRPVFYVQVPDSGPAGVLSAVADALESFGVPADRFPRPHDFGDLARLVAGMARAGYAVVLDEFQYFNRARLRPFCSFLQAEVDGLASDAGRVRGGLLVLGSIHTEMRAILEDRSAPLFNRTTDEIVLTHLDIASLKAMLREHADLAPERLLFLWTLFEGVPKFYRDCYEQGVLNQDRRTLLRRIFFESSSPLRTEAENWFLKELRGHYDVVLKFVARHAGCLHNELMGEIQQVSGENSQQVGGYLKVLSERYRLIEKKLPVFAPQKARRRPLLPHRQFPAGLAGGPGRSGRRDQLPSDGAPGGRRRPAAMGGGGQGVREARWYPLRGAQSQGRRRLPADRAGERLLGPQRHGDRPCGHQRGGQDHSVRLVQAVGKRTGRRPARLRRARGTVPGPVSPVHPLDGGASVAARPESRTTFASR